MKSAKISAILLVLVMLTTCFVGGTFAKYYDKDSQQVTGIAVEGFGIQVKYVVDSDTSEITARNDYHPGSTGQVQFQVSGTPTVPAALDATFADGSKDIFVDDYHPLQFTLTKTGTTDPIVENVALSALASAINDLSATYAANVAVSETYTISWVWPIGDVSSSAASGNDDKDMLLSDLADGIITRGSGYNLDLDFTFDFVVYQTAAEDSGTEPTAAP